MNNFQIAKKYANDIIKNKIPSSIFLKQTCKRFLDDVKSKSEYYVDENVLDYVINFIEQFDLTETPFKQKTKLQPFQIFLLCNIKALFSKKKKTLKYRIIYIEIPRGNAKTQLISWLSILELLTGTDAQVVYAANTTKQAMEVGFDKIKKLIHQIDPQEKYIKVYYNRIVYGDNKLIITSNESKPIDGLSGSLMCIDEYHEFQSTQTFDVLKSSMVKRSDNQLFIITTAGFNLESECYKMRQYSIDILSKKFKDESQFSLIYTIDDGDDFNDKRNWIKANPMLNISVNEDVINQEVIKANQNPAEKPSILVKHFNIWLKNKTEYGYIDKKYIDKASKQINIKDFKNCDLYCGVDLSTVSDISAVSFMFSKDDKFYFFNKYYLCEDSIENNVNKNLYKQAINNNQIKITSGNVIDYDEILSDIIDVNNEYQIIKLGYDKWNATQFAINATNEGIYLEQYSQLSGNLNKPLKEFERLIKSGNIIIEDNLLTKWMFDNVVLKLDERNGNYSIKKNSRNKKIDGVASMINALGVYLDSPSYGINIY
jgi:phage terminase large subunit-like protein